MLPSPEPADEVMHNVSEIIGGDDNSLTTMVDGGDYQAASSRMYAVSSILNVPTHLVGVLTS